tara:strand:+ start:5808 stop:5936 length:129 start_codon:yes stop_codon:yes gene_type:complete
MLKTLDSYYAQSLKKFYLDKLIFLNIKNLIKQIYFLNNIENE